MSSEQAEKILKGNLRAVAQALSIVENDGSEQVRELLKELYRHSRGARILGVTGSPGAGKSTLVDRLAAHYREAGRKVGIIAVDPSSPFSGGAILGDRIRMQSLSTDPKVFIRSMAARGRMGGLSPTVQDALVVLDAAGFETLIVETVGVGQDEVDIVKTADVTLVVLVPGMGDDIQTIKAGIMEIGDIFVINKADYEGVLRSRQELQALLSISSRADGWDPKIVETVATQGKGISELTAAISDYLNFLADPDRDASRLKYLYRERLMEMVRDRLQWKLLRHCSESTLDRYAEQLMEGEVDPYTLVDTLLEELENK